MARLSKCKTCEKEITTSEKCVFKGKSYCSECYSVLHREAEAYKALMDSICKSFNISQPTGLILRQVKEYKNEMNYSYAAMNYTLWYITEIMRFKLDCKYGVALFKYNYDDAKRYFEQQQKITTSIENAEIKRKIVKKQSSNSVNTFNTLVDISKIIEGGDINKL